MPEIAPFAALRYDFSRTDRDLSALVAPPYDVLDEADKSALLARSDRNIVAIDLPHLPPKSAGPDEVYLRSARLLDEWLADRTLVRENTPALYLYHQRFRHAGKSHTRRMFIARVRLQPFCEGSILPHEKTFGGPKEDRLALMKATKCQLSAILGMYTDPGDAIGSAFSSTAAKAPDVSATLNEVENLMWIVTDSALVDSVVGIMADRKIYIADGHHRYGTALLYRDHLASQRGGSLGLDDPANFIMFVLASMDDPGCLILPYHRALANVDFGAVLDAWSEGTERTTSDRADLIVWDGMTEGETALRFTNRGALKKLEPDRAAPWYDLDYAYLHRYLIDELLTGHGVTPEVRYVKSVEAAKATARNESGVALLMNATPMSHLRAVAEAGGLMPPKSTYFHPKLATGLTINALERIRISCCSSPAGHASE